MNRARASVAHTVSCVSGVGHCATDCRCVASSCSAERRGALRNGLSTRRVVLLRRVRGALRNGLSTRRVVFAPPSGVGHRAPDSSIASRRLAPSSGVGHWRPGFGGANRVVERVMRARSHPARRGRTLVRCAGSLPRHPLSTPALQAPSAQCPTPLTRRCAASRPVRWFGSASATRRRGALARRRTGAACVRRRHQQSGPRGRRGERD